MKIDTSDRATLLRAGMPLKEEVETADRRLRELRAAEDKKAAIREKYDREHPPAVGLTAEERAEAGILGLQRAAKKARSAGNTGRAAALDGLLKDARAAWKEACSARAESKALPTDVQILQKAAKPVAEKLMATLGGFASEAEAIQFVRDHWPLTEARLAFSKAADQRSRLSRTYNEKQKACWRAIERGACLVTGIESNAAVATIVAMGTRD